MFFVCHNHTDYTVSNISTIYITNPHFEVKKRTYFKCESFLHGKVPRSKGKDLIILAWSGSLYNKTRECAPAKKEVYVVVKNKHKRL